MFQSLCIPQFWFRFYSPYTCSVLCPRVLLQTIRQISKLFQTIHNRSAELAVAKSELELVHERYAYTSCLPLSFFLQRLIRALGRRSSSYRTPLTQKNKIRLHFFYCMIAHELM